MAEPPRKIYREARQKAATQRRVRNGPSKKTEPGKRNPGRPSVNGTVVPELTPPPPPPTTPTRDWRRRILWASVMHPVESLSPPPPEAATNPSLPPSLVAREEMCPFHREAEVQRGTLAKGWAYVRCPEPKCPYWEPATKAAVISEMTRNQLHQEIAEGPWICYCWEASCVGLVNKNAQSPNLGRAYLSCSQEPKCYFFQWVNRPWSKYVLEVRRRLRQMPVIHSIFWAPENQWQKADRPTYVGDSPLPPQRLIVHGDTYQASCVC